MVLAICIANGASLTREDVEYCQGKGIVYAVKEAVYLAPWADAVYAADGDWWQLKNGLPEYTGEKIGLEEKICEKYGLTCQKYDAKLVWGSGDTIATGGNSGFQAVNIAVNRGATKVILLGYDMGYSTNKHWWTGQFKRDCRPSNYKDWIDKFTKAAPLIPAEIINCTRETALNCFKRADLRDVI